jgi:purine-binding chemotaxis protein CheW
MLQHTESHAISAVNADRSFDLLECVTFQLGAEQYGIDLDAVQELVPYSKLVRAAGMPTYILGTVPLREHSIPVIDLRLKLQCSAVNYDSTASVIILNVDNQLLGIVANDIIDVIAFNWSQIRPMVSSTRPIWADYLRENDHHEARKLPLIDINRLLSLPKAYRRDMQAASHEHCQ